MDAVVVANINVHTEIEAGSLSEQGHLGTGGPSECALEVEFRNQLVIGVSK